MLTNRQKKNHLQLIWGIALVAVGVAVFFRTSEIIPKMQDLNQSSGTLVFIRICFYLMGIILVGGGARKILHFFSASSSSSTKADTKTKKDVENR